MGVRFASSRHLDVVVMAPALTEAGQSQNFKLPPTAHSSHTAPLSVLNGLSNLSVSKLLKNKFLSKIGQTVISVGESGKFDAQCLNGLTSKLSEDSVSLDRLATLAIASELLKVPVGAAKSSEPAIIIPGDLKRTPVQGGDTIMNNCALFMEDDDINMGIQSTTPVPSLGNASCVKDKNMVNDMDQLFKNLGADISNHLNSTGDLGQNVDELLQVIKSMESATSENDSGVFRHMEGSESEEMFPISDGTDLTGGLSSFERVLFNDEDVMDLCGGVQLADNNIAAETKELLTKERIVESRKIQFELERKCDWLVRRLQKLQTRVMGKHIGEELTGFLEQTHRMIELKVKPITASEHVKGDDNVPSVLPTTSGGSEQKSRGISSTVMSNMIQRLDLVSQQQGSVRARQSNKNFHVDSNNHQRIPVLVPKFDDNTRQELHHVSSQLHTQLKLIESAIDSDATASSSGGESCDEMQAFNNQHQLQLTISKRAAWKWARDRAAIAGRWTWLQAQISDLEYRIRQHNELYRQLRVSKGQVFLGEHPVASTSAASPRNNHNVVVNGFHGVLPGATPGKPRGEVLNGTVLGGATSSSSPASSRTRPLNRAIFRKRKLLQGAGLHIASRKAARPATMRCKCILQEKRFNPCLLCTGRLDPTAGIQTDVMTLPERLAVLDPTLHPVLSFPDEVRESVHYAAKLQSTELQQKMLRTSLKVLKASNLKEGEHVLQERRNFKLDPRTKYKTRLKKNILNSTISSKIRRTLAKAGRKPKSYFDSNHTIQRLNKSKSKASMGVNYNEHRYSADYSEESGARGSRHPSPEPGYTMGMCERFAKERRKRENSYDIDNIIIPRSYSSAARVEILNYKEIPTPKWRLVEETTDVDTREKDFLATASVDSDVEDCTDEAIALRHEKCLADEKKKFSLAIKMPPFLRGRAQRRTDSLAESSGANTPDPMSPANLLDQGRESCSGSPMASPPATPQPFITDTDSNLSQPQCPSIRRRTISQSRLVREKEELMRCASPDFTPEVAPFEQRTFPLPEEVIEKILRTRPEEQVPLPVVIEEPKKLLPPQLSPTIEEDEEELDAESRPLSPCSDSTDSVNGEGDDPNDPEWTVQETRDLERERLKTAVKR